MIGIHQQAISETLGKDDGIALIDESSAVKQGGDSVGVAAQYCGWDAAVVQPALICAIRANIRFRSKSWGETFPKKTGFQPLSGRWVAPH